MSMSVTCLHIAILTCLSVTLSGNSVDLNTTLSSVPTLASSQDTTLSPRTDAQSTIHPTRPLNVTEVTSTLGYTQILGNRMTPIAKSSVMADATISSEETDEMSSATPTTATPKSTATTTLTSTKVTSTATTESPSTTSPTTTHSTSVSTASSPTSAPGINVIRMKGKMKKLSLADIANSASTTTIANKPANQKTNRKKRKPRKMQSPKQNENPRSTSQKSSRGSQSKKKPASPTGPTPTATSLHGAKTTAAPLSPDATIRVHTIDTGVKPVAFAAAASEKKKNAGKGKKGSKKANKANKAQGKKGDKGPAGPPGPKGAKGEPGQAAQASMSMQAASSSVLTEHFGPDKDVIVPFDLKLIDLADNYDNTTGVFICTIPGVYVISLYLMSHPGAKVNARIFINSRPIAALWADDSKNSGFYPSSSIQTISRLEFGDQVYVMLVDGGYGESWVHANYNAFTLFLLYEEVFFK